MPSTGAGPRGSANREHPQHQGSHVILRHGGSRPKRLKRHQCQRTGTAVRCVPGCRALVSCVDDDTLAGTKTFLPGCAAAKRASAAGALQLGCGRRNQEDPTRPQAQQLFCTCAGRGPRREHIVHQQHPARDRTDPVTASDLPTDLPHPGRRIPAPLPPPAPPHQQRAHRHAQRPAQLMGEHPRGREPTRRCPPSRAGHRHNHVNTRYPRPDQPGEVAPHRLEHRGTATVLCDTDDIPQRAGIVARRPGHCDQAWRGHQPGKRRQVRAAGTTQWQR